MKEFNTGCQKSCSKHMEGTSKQEKYRESQGEEKKKKKTKDIYDCYAKNEIYL